MEKRGVSTIGQSTFSKWTAAKPVAKQKHFLVWAWHGALVASQLAQKPGGQQLPARTGCCVAGPGTVDAVATVREQPIRSDFRCNRGGPLMAGLTHW